MLPDPKVQNTPARVARDAEIRRKIMAGEALVPTAPTSPPLQTPSASTSSILPVADFSSPMEALVEIMRRTSTNQTVSIGGEFGVIHIKAAHISINDYGIAIIVDKENMIYEPRLDTELQVTIDGKQHKVVYIGGYFTFGNIPFNLLSFVKISDDK